MKVKLGEWEQYQNNSRATIDTDIGVIEVDYETVGTIVDVWHGGLRNGYENWGCDYNWILYRKGFATADEAKAWIVAEYQKLVLSLIEVE